MEADFNSTNKILYDGQGMLQVVRNYAHAERDISRKIAWQKTELL
jgi:hypothetical protein